MAVANTKSTIVTNADASPPVLTTSYLNGGVVRECVAYVTPAAADDDNSVYRICRLPSNVRISQILVKHAAVTGMTDTDLGFYRTAADGGAVVDVNAFWDAIDLSSARNVFTDVTETPLAANTEKRLWELDPAPLTEDPKTEYDICLTCPTVGSGTAEIAFLVRYVM
jgi:hypothetical protein